MCGIAGVVRIDGHVHDSSVEGTLDALADALTHRGPDEREIYLSGAVGLAFTRLSLVDPVGGSQPLVSPDGDLVLIANGEIYNHRELAARLPGGGGLRTDSDCEVLLPLYREHGLDFLDDVRGMFGLIMWDRRENKLVLARDRFGVKPLYFHRDSRRIVLASEITALFADRGTPRAVDWQKALTTPLLPAAPYFGDGPTTTWFEGVQQVEAGTVVQIDLTTGATVEHRYWSFPGAGDESELSEGQFIDSYRSLLIDSIGECATADAELGLFLSGGIDSAAVAAIAARRIPDLHTFTVLSASTYRAEDAEYAHRLAAQLGIPNHQVLFEPGRYPTPAEWRRLLWLTETPFCGPEMYYKHELHRYAKNARPNLRGMLLGAASDEFNGGYSVGLAEGGDWSAFAANIGSMSRTAALRARPDLMPWWSAGSRALLTDDVIDCFTPGPAGDAYDHYLRWEYRKIQQYNVWHEDRTAAGSGIEARVPFLDHRLVELSASVPRRMRRDLLWRKQILREAMRGILPDEFVERPKGPFFYGSGLRHTYRAFLRMLQADGGALLEEAIAAPGADRFLDGDAIRSSVSDLQSRPDSADVEIVLRVVNLGLLASMVSDLPKPTAVTPAGAAPVSLRVTDWEQQRIAIEEVTGARPVLRGDQTPRWADHVLLLTDAVRAQAMYVLADGQIEYVIDELGTPLADLLTAIDGNRSLDAIVSSAGLAGKQLPEEFIDLIDEGLVELEQTGPAPTDIERTAADPVDATRA